MADRIKGKSAKASLVFHDGTSMIVINEGKPYDVDVAHEKRLVDGGVIEGKAEKAASDVQPVTADSAGQTQPDPLDHDNDGKKGGAAPAADAKPADDGKKDETAPAAPKAADATKAADAAKAAPAAEDKAP